MTTFYKPNAEDRAAYEIIMKDIRDAMDDLCDVHGYVGWQWPPSARDEYAALSEAYRAYETLVALDDD